MEAREERKLPGARGSQAQAAPQEPELDPDLGSHRPPGGLLLENKSAVQQGSSTLSPLQSPTWEIRHRSWTRACQSPDGCPRAP